jgi:hypothetical protein
MSIIEDLELEKRQKITGIFYVNIDNQFQKAYKNPEENPALDGNLCPTKRITFLIAILISSKLSFPS